MRGGPIEVPESFSASNGEGGFKVQPKGPLLCLLVTLVSQLEIDHLVFSRFSLVCMFSLQTELQALRRVEE